MHRALLLVCVLAVSCTEGPSRQRCHVGREALLATSADPRLGAIALAVSGDGRRVLVAWSERTAVRALVVDPAGAARDRSRVVLEGGAKALAAAADGDGWRLAAVVPDDAKAGGGGALLVTLGRRGDRTARTWIGPAGVHSRDVALVEGPDGWVLAWHDGTPSAFAVRTWVGGRASVAPTASGHTALAPTLARDGRGVALAWADMTAFPGGRLETDVLVARIGSDGRIGPAENVATSSVEGADPVLFVADGRLGLVYRDEEDGDGREEYFVADAVKGAKRHRVSRANGSRSPSVVTCHGSIAGAAVRSFAGELLVGFNRFDPRATKRGGELQIYSDGVNFGEAVLGCLPTGYVLGYAEEGDASRLLVSRVVCDP